MKQTVLRICFYSYLGQTLNNFQDGNDQSVNSNSLTEDDTDEVLSFDPVIEN